MPHSLRAAGCVRNSLSYHATTQNVWISDQLLADVFHRFTRNQRRYGSNVPGPLEAQRRAPKRKNTSLAHHDTQTPPPDPALIFGPVPLERWWQTAPSPAVEKPSRLLPSWLRNPPDIMHSHHIKKSPEVRSQDHSRRNLHEKYAEQLKDCSDLSSIRLLLRSLQLKPRLQPEITDFAFKRVWNIYLAYPLSSDDMLSDFLTDPELNPAGSRNHLNFLQEISKGQITSKRWDSFVLPTLCKAVRLGLVGATDLQQMLLDLPTILQGAGLASKLENGLPISDWQRLLTGMQSCQVLGMKDLDEGFTAEWVQMLSRTAPSTAVTKLMWRLRGQANHHDLEVFLDYLLPRMRHLSANAETILQDIAKAVGLLPAEKQGLALLRASQKLVASSLAGHVSKAELDVWHQFVTQLRHIRPGLISISAETWQKTSITTTMLTPAQNLMTLAWTVSSLLNGQSEDAHNTNDYGFVAQFAQICHSNISDTNHDVLSQMVTTLDTLPLPRKDLLYQHLSCWLNANIASLFELQNYDDSMQKFMNRDFRVFDDERFHHWATQNWRHELTVVAESANNNLAALSTMCQVIIMKDKARLKIVRRILEHNASMKLAVSFWPEQMSVLKGLGHRFAGLRPEDVVAFVHRLALSAAISPVLEPRSALRNVQYFYGWLRRYSAPVLPLMSRALWHAGVTRYGKGGCPSTQFRWCLSKVEEIEGSEVKRMLLWSAGHRRHWATEMDGYKSMADHSNAQQLKQSRKVGTSKTMGCSQTDQHRAQQISTSGRNVVQNGHTKRARP